ncbi:Ig-like domain-containing protein [Bacillus sp. B190/17]|uniref:Ig-like domain-containing protein n=1 Tax=Bacillus lumedeiriae TaxID=3058829 RepID=A0ABW8I5Z4_9BACI
MKKSLSFIVFAFCFLVIQVWNSSASVQAKDDVIYWSDVQRAVYEPLYPHTLEWSGNPLKSGGFDLDAVRVTKEAQAADFVINSYGHIGARKIAEMTNQSLTEPLSLNSVKFPADGLGYPLTSLTVKQNAVYLIQLENGKYAKVKIDALSASKVQFSFVLEEDASQVELPYEDDEPQVDESYVTDLYVAQKSITVDQGKAAELKLIAQYSDYTKKDITNLAAWHSANPKIATVSKGKIAGVSAGQTIITAQYEGLTIEIQVKVNGKQPPPIKGIPGTAIATGENHTLVLKKNGTVWTFGWNQTGQLGNGTTVNSFKAVQVKGLNKVVDIAAGYNYSLALQSNGTVWMWGSPLASVYGPKPIPYKIPITNVKDIASGEEHMIALKKDGTVWIWGNNNYGQAGNGTTKPATITTPIQVKGLNKVIAIAGGRYHTLALKSDGTVWAFGNNERGQIGNGKTGQQLMNNVVLPYRVNGLTDVKAIAAGTYYSLAVKKDGTIWSWGDNDTGQLGSGLREGIKSYPVPVKGINNKGNVTNILQVDGGNRHSIAITNNGNVVTWGENTYGKLGNGRETPIYDVWSPSQNTNVPVPVSLKNIVQSGAGQNHTVVLTSAGAVYTWGSNEYGQLGLRNSVQKRSAPVLVMNAAK